MSLKRVVHHYVEQVATQQVKIVIPERLVLPIPIVGIITAGEVVVVEVVVVRELKQGQCDVRGQMEQP